MIECNRKEPSFSNSREKQRGDVFDEPEPSFMQRNESETVHDLEKGRVGEHEDTLTCGVIPKEFMAFQTIEPTSTKIMNEDHCQRQKMEESLNFKQSDSSSNLTLLLLHTFLMNKSCCMNCCSFSVLVMFLLHLF